MIRALGGGLLALAGTAPCGHSLPHVDTRSQQCNRTRQPLTTALAPSSPGSLPPPPAAARARAPLQRYRRCLFGAGHRKQSNVQYTQYSTNNTVHL